MAGAGARAAECTRCVSCRGRLAGYDVAACSQPASVGEALRYLVTMPSAACFLLCLVSLYFYPINEARRNENRWQLERYPCATYPPTRPACYFPTPAPPPLPARLRLAHTRTVHILALTLDALSETLLKGLSEGH